MTWQPSPDWHPLTAGTGQSTGGVWLTSSSEVVKRLVPGVADPRHHAYWQRQALVAESGIVAATPGLRSPACLGVERDPTGITLRMAYAAPTQWSPVALAAALGRFARSSVDEPAWGARDVLRDRLATVERRGGWSALAHAGLNQKATDALWVRRDAAPAPAITCASRTERRVVVGSVPPGPPNRPPGRRGQASWQPTTTRPSVRAERSGTR